MYAINTTNIGHLLWFTILEPAVGLESFEFDFQCAAAYAYAA